MKLNIRHIIVAIVAIALGATATFAAGTPVDLTPAVAIKYMGQPAHGSWCNYLNVPDGSDAEKEGKFNLLPSTTLSGDATVTTNYGEVVTTTVSGNTVNFTTRYGLSGSVNVCFEASDTAPDWGAIGIGNAPTSAPATVKYLASAALHQFHDKNTVRDVNILLEKDGTNFDIELLTGTKVTVWLGDVPLGECTTAGTCNIKSPENTTFADLGKGMYVRLVIEYDGSTSPVPATMGLDMVP